jgi:hypothetical protein
LRHGKATSPIDRARDLTPCRPRRSLRRGLLYVAQSAKFEETSVLRRKVATPFPRRSLGKGGSPLANS